MRIIFVGGGTAGHINPALAVASYIKDHSPKSQILYVGAEGGMEQDLVKKAGFNFKGITVSGFSRKLSFEGIKHNFITLKNIFLASNQSKKILIDFKPDICMGTGGYVSGPFLRQAGKLGIPYVIHEQNAFPGMTTKLLAKKAAKIMLATDGAKKFLDKNLDIITTGNPIRTEINNISQSEAKKILHFDDRPVILSFGGSLGAKVINENIAELIISDKRTKLYNYIHAFGKNGKFFIDILKNSDINFEYDKRFFIKEYIYNMSVCMAAADLVICRAGAITISEICSCGKASILIPSPNVAENHQYYNAMELVDAGAADIIIEKNLNKNVFIEKVHNLLNDKIKLNNYKQNAQKLAINNSNEMIFRIIQSKILASKNNT